MTLADLSRSLDPIKRKIFLLLGRALLTAVKSSGKVQRIQVTGLKGETISDVEHLQPYGLEASPAPGCEAFLVFMDGNRDQGIAICVTDRDNRPTDLVKGDTCLWSSHGGQVKLKADGTTLKTGDAAPWMPNTIAVCPFTGKPHGGAGAGIVKLKGE